MKKTIRTLTVMVMVVLMLTIATIPAMAVGFDFETAIAEFKSTSLNTISLKANEKHTPTAALWAQQGMATCYSSDESVVTVSNDGTVTAVGEGTAYVAIDTGSMYELYCYNVSGETTNGGPGSADNNVSSGNGAQNNTDNVINQHQENLNKINGMFADNFEKIQTHQKFVYVGMVFAFAFIGFCGYVVVTTMFKTSRLTQLIAEVESNPCQGTAEKLHKALTKLNSLHRLVFKLGGQGIIKKQVWSTMYKHYILPSKVILPETKEGIHKALIAIGVFNLRTNGNDGSAYDSQQRGDLGEDNVWHTLTALVKREKCNIFHSVRVGVGKDSQEIDNVIVSPKGIFLIEVKSVTHKPINPYDGSDVVVFDDIPENPYQQIFDHETEFVKAFGLKGAIKNLLVMSYPHKEKKKIDISTFPTDTIYTALKVDDLLEYYMNYNSDVVLDDATIASVSQKLTKCINYKNGVSVTKYMFSEVADVANAVSETTVNPTEQQAKFCPQCGNKLTTKTPFCPNCGSKLN